MRSHRVDFYRRSTSADVIDELGVAVIIIASFVLHIFSKCKASYTYNEGSIGIWKILQRPEIKVNHRAPFRIIWRHEVKINSL